MKNFYGFEYTDGSGTTCGEPNRGFERFNGRLSKAGSAVCFNSKGDRDEWLNGNCSNRGGRIACNRSELRRLCAGMENESFKQYLEEIQYMGQRVI